MKKFTTEEISDLLNRVCREEISFSEMVDMINNRVSKASEPKFKNGDFVVGFGCVFILHTQIDEKCIQYYALYAKTNGNLYYYRTFSQSGSTYGLRLATESEKQELLDALAKKGKIWNAEKLCIENMQVHKFKIGDKVRIKNGVSSRTHGSIRPFFANSMDKLIGKELTVEYCDNSEFVICDGYSFLKEWLEPYVEESKKDDEDIPKRKFKKGDKVRIKAGISSKTHYRSNPWFVREMDDLIGKTMTVSRYAHECGHVVCNECDCRFHEDWLEPYEELKKGDLAIFWDEAKKCAIVRIYDRLDESEDYLQNKDNTGMFWENAIKFESKEQYEKLLKGEI